MKLTKIALSLVVLAGGAITGGSWYTGKQAEEKYQEFVTLGNEGLKQLKVYGIEAEIKNVSLERGVFSSTVKYQVEAKTPEETFVFDGNDQLFHGPLPLNRLKQGNFLPVVASVESNVTAPEKLKSLFGDKAVLTGTNTITYAGGLDGTLTFNELKVKEDNADLQIGAITTNYALDKDRKGKSSVNLPSVVIKGKDDVEGDFELAMNGVRYDINITEKSQYDMLGSLGDYVAEMQSITVKFSDGGFDLKDVKSKGYGKLNGERYESAGDFNGKFIVNKEGKSYPLGSLSVDFFMDSAAKPLNDLMSLGVSGEQMQSDEAAQAAVLALVKKAPQVHLKSLALENEKGKSDLSIILNLNEFNPESINSFEEGVAIFKQSAITMNANIASLEAFFQALAPINGTTEEGAKAIVAHLVEQAKSTESFVVDNEAIKLKLDIDGGKIKLNDRELSEGEVQGMLFMLVMMFGGMGL